mmetsp:Transcript_22220/g.25727  ORF Transcript_22220/g.25727 Transcript_22220/m.25727 type:complete len:134 (-) Transcript_22220:760-1161(-)
MAAFACLQRGVLDDNRYECDSLHDKSVFINGGTSLVGQAAIQLCVQLNAKLVYATGAKKDYDHLRNLGAVPLNLNSISNLEYNLMGQIDIIIDFTTFDMMDYLLKIKHQNGSLIYYEYGDITRTGGHGWRSQM